MPVLTETRPWFPWGDGAALLASARGVGTQCSECWGWTPSPGWLWLISDGGCWSFTWREGRGGEGGPVPRETWGEWLMSQSRFHKDHWVDGKKSFSNTDREQSGERERANDYVERKKDFSLTENISVETPNTFFSPSNGWKQLTINLACHPCLGNGIISQTHKCA